MTDRPRILYVTDPGYPANGREYGEEDVRLSADLGRAFDVTTCHPTDVATRMADADTVVVRNSGPVIRHQKAYDTFITEARRQGTVVYNPLTGRGDMAGKQYLVDLMDEGLPVIPTVDRLEEVGRLPRADTYVVKPKAGADSIGLTFVDAEELVDHLARVTDGVDGDDLLIQPLVDFRYEVSFYVVDATLQYALHAPDPGRRWVLDPYQPSSEDRAFVQRFIGWNTMSHGIQRVDACRTQDGELLLVELEDLNPYLSLDRVDAATRERFVGAMIDSVRANLAAARC